MSLNNDRVFFNSKQNSQRGFTLLEMVLVLLIMGMVASLSVVFIDNEDNQLRYQDTLQKLQAMHDATVTVKEYGSDFLFSGFAVDNGTLPESAAEYISLPTGWTERTLFNSLNKPKYRIEQTKSYNDIEIDGINLYKGYRTGYIQTGIDSAGEYKTAWGNDFIVAGTSGVLNLTYDESLNPADYSHSVNKDVPQDSWSIALSELEIHIKNTSGSGTEAGPVIIALSVFKNIAPDPTSTVITNNSVWQTYHYRQYCKSDGTKKSIRIDDTTVTATDISDIDDGDTFTKKGLWHTEATITSAETAQTACTHSDNVDNTLAMSARIPAGEHIIFAWVDNNTNDIIDSGDKQSNTAIIKVIPRFTQPTVTLEIN